MKTANIYITIALSAVVVGTVGGILIKRYGTDEDIVYEGDTSSLELNAEELLRRYEEYKGNTPENEFTATELINIGLEKYRTCENSYSYGIGTAHTVVEQQIRNYQIKNGEQYFEESISTSSMVSLANRMKQTGKTGDVTLYNGTATDVEVGDYSGTPTTYSQQDYINLMGRSLDKMFIYIISNSTVMNSNVEKQDGNYVIDVELDPTFSTVNYKSQMKNISGLDKLPKFQYVKLKFTFTSEMYLKTMSVDEKYEATMYAMTVPITNEINYYYYPNEVMNIPQDNESLDYSRR